MPSSALGGTELTARRAGADHVAPCPDALAKVPQTAASKTMQQRRSFLGVEVVAVHRIHKEEQ